MSLVRLLATGKSLVDVKDESRYHVTTQRLLPKFGSAKNPFRGAQRTETPAAETAPALKTAPAPRPPVIVSEGSAPASAPVAPVAPVAPLRASPPPARSWFGSVLARLSGWFSGSPRASQRTPSAIPQFKAPVQTELRLESIKVVRNDLSDSDLEVVSSPAAAAPVESAPAAKPEAKAEPCITSWGRVSSRLFSAGKTLS